MDFSCFVKIINDLIKILKDSIQILIKNGKKLASITILSFLIYSVFFILHFFSTKPLMDDISTKIMQLPSINPASPEFFSIVFGYIRDAGLLLGVEILYNVAYRAVSLVMMSLTISISSLSYTGKSHSFKELFSNAKESYKGLFVTYLFVQLMSIGYMVLVFLISYVPLLVFLPQIRLTLRFLYPFWILAFVLFTGLTVVWILALVVSVVEKDCYGLQALGKSARIIKGNRLNGLILTLGLNLIFLVIFWILMHSRMNQIVSGLVIVLLVCLMQLFEFTIYTSLYFDCKKNHNKEIGDYIQLPTTDIP
jgi:hypothetical protein